MQEVSCWLESLLFGCSYNRVWSYYRLFFETIFVVVFFFIFRMKQELSYTIFLYHRKFCMRVGCTFFVIYHIVFTSEYFIVIIVLYLLSCWNDCLGDLMLNVKWFINHWRVLKLVVVIFFLEARKALEAGKQEGSFKKSSLFS